ncbi:MAG: DUF1735 domain-containing protein, partial [Bacteroidales bacterium]|nr:DUF1735 domain-containing protein [Bacteroidales bacterium]
MKRFFNMAAIALAVLSISVSCQKEGPVDPYSINYVYVYGPLQSDYTLQYYASGEFKKSIDTEKALVPARCTKPAPADIHVSFEIDGSLVEKYNSENGTDCALLENVTLENKDLVIRKGEYISADSLRVVYNDMAEFQNGKGEYLLPITITSVSGPEVSQSERSVFYLHYTSSAIYAEIVSSPAGTLISDTSGWSITFYGTDCTGDVAADNSDGIGWYSWEGNGLFNVDLGSLQKVSALRFKWYAWYYAATDVHLSASADGETWKDMGSYSLNVGYSNVEYLSVLTPAGIRYIELEFSGNNYNYGTSYYPYLTNIGVYVA